MNLYDAKEDALCDVMRIAYYAYNSCKTTGDVEKGYFENCRDGLSVCNCLTVNACVKLHKLVCNATKINIDIEGIAQKVRVTTHSKAYIRRVYADKLVYCLKHKIMCKNSKTTYKVEKLAYYDLYGENAISKMIDLMMYDGKWLEQDALGLICLLHCYIDIYTQVYIYGLELKNVGSTTKKSTFVELCNCLMAMFVPTDAQCNDLYDCITDIRNNRVYANLFTYTEKINKLRYGNDEQTVVTTWACVERVITYLTKNSIDCVNQSAFTWFNALYDFWQH